MQNATPLESFVYKGIKIFIKREDAQITGSHKDRGVWPLLEFYRKKKVQAFVISSSGNAAISAAHYCSGHGLALDVFVGMAVSSRKYGRLLKYASKDISIHESQTPRKDAFQFAQKNGIQLISTAQDDHCLGGYATLAKELPKDMDVIFIPASSGALAVGLFQGFQILNRARTKQLFPKFFIIQTPRVYSLISDDVDKTELTSKSSMADAISDIVGSRKGQIHEIIVTTSGGGVVAEDRFINNAMKILVKQLKITNPSPNGALAFAGFLKVLAKGDFSHQKVVCLYTGE